MFTLSLDAPAVGAARLRLAGHLDDAAARDVLHAAADVVRCGCSRLVVDLGDLQSFDDEAAYCVTGCCRLARFLAEGVAVVAGFRGRRGARPHGRRGAAPRRCPRRARPCWHMVSCPAC